MAGGDSGGGGGSPLGRGGPQSRMAVRPSLWRFWTRMHLVGSTRVCEATPTPSSHGLQGSGTRGAEVGCGAQRGRSRVMTRVPGPEASCAAFQGRWRCPAGDSQVSAASSALPGGPASGSARRATLERAHGSHPLCHDQGFSTRHRELPRACQSCVNL